MNIGNTGQTILKYGIKAAGALGIGMIAYDAHKYAKHKSNISANKARVDATMYYLDNAMHASSPSAVNDKIKWKLFDLESRNTLRGAIGAAKGYVRGFVGMLTDDIVPLGLSLAALLTKGKIAPKVAGGALGAYSLYAFAKNILGIGVNQGYGNTKI